MALTNKVEEMYYNQRVFRKITSKIVHLICKKRGREIYVS